jgi:trk system potassium uptake protein TrkA
LRIILVGHGELAYYLARQFAARSYNVTVIVDDPADAGELSRRLDVPVIAADGTDMLVLEQAGARRADVILALTPCDADNLAICQISDRAFQVPRTIALVNDPDNEEVFHRLNVSSAISATRILSTILQEEAGFEQIAEMMPLAQGKISVTEVYLRPEAPAVNRTLRELQLPKSSLVGGLIHAREVSVPDGNTRLQAGDRLVLIATSACLDEALALLVGKTP